MCLIATIIMFVLDIQNLMQAHWIVGAVQFIIAFAFFILLLKHIQEARCNREVSCNNTCMLTAWISKIFPKKDH